MQANYVQRLRLTLEKNGPARYIGHLDLARTIERALNRAHIPMAYTQGFNRHPRLSFAAPLPLGYTSEGELADIWLMEKMNPGDAGEKMNQKSAPGTAIKDVEEISLKSPSLQTMTASAEYLVRPFDPIPQQELSSKVALLLAEQNLIRERRRGKGKVKKYDLRPLILGLSVSDDQNGDVVLSMTLALMAGKTGRPDEVLSALGLDPLAAHIHRTNIVLDEASSVN